MLVGSLSTKPIMILLKEIYCCVPDVSLKMKIENVFPISAPISEF